MTKYKSSPPTISAIVPNFNSSEFLPTSILSLINQTAPFKEIIIVDDGSTDNSIAVIEQLIKQYPQIRLIRHKQNQGVTLALNTGIAHAIGDYILLGAADDSYGPHLVLSSQKVIEQYPTVGVICGDAEVKRFDLQSVFHRMLPFPENTYISPTEFKQLTKKMYVGFNGGGGMIINRQVVLNAGMMHPDIRWHSDWLLYFVAAFQNGIYYVKDVFVHINMRAASYSEGKHNNTIQFKVMLDTLSIIKKHYPELWDDFKIAGLVPHHSISYLFLFLSHPLGRQFLSPRLIWKNLINNRITINLGRLFPYRIILNIRKFLRA